MLLLKISFYVLQVLCNNYTLDVRKVYSTFHKHYVDVSDKILVSGCSYIVHYISLHDVPMFLGRSYDFRYTEDTDHMDRMHSSIQNSLDT